MMFNGLLMCGDSDNSDITKDSGGACSLVDSATGSSDGNTRATYYHSKLLSTLQILQNKEETIRVQAESLAVAEGRILALTERSTELRKDLERKNKELQALRKTLECCRAEKVDVSITDTEDQSGIVSTLQNNLNVIEDLYRECFYETAKQEDLIEVLRKSYLDMRMMDKHKEDQIGKLQTVINTQKWSLDRCQDIVLEVDSLKMEISNFLSSSTSTNNDSGMWERSEESFTFAPGVQEELQDVTEQLLGLQELLATDSTFDFEAENKRLKLENDAMTRKISELCKMNCEVELALMEHKSREQNYQEEIKIKEQQLTSMREELTELMKKSADNNRECEKLTTQLRQTQVLLGEKNEELEQMQQQCSSHQATISELRQELNKADHICEENCKIRSEVSYLTTQVSQWRDQLTNSEDRVRTLDAKLRHAQACYREKENSVSELQVQLECAHARGAALCQDARRALCSVQHWARRMRDRHREQQNRIKAKDDLIAILQQQVDDRTSSSGHCMNISHNEPSCSKCSSPRQTSFCPRRSQCFATSASEMASSSSAPIPPKRRLKKNSICGDTRCPAAPWLCDESTQQPIRQDRCVESRTACCSRRREPNPRDISPIDEVFTRVEQLSEALADGYRRWTRPELR